MEEADASRDAIRATSINTSNKTPIIIATVVGAVGFPSRRNATGNPRACVILCSAGTRRQGSGRVAKKPRPARAAGPSEEQPSAIARHILARKTTEKAELGVRHALDKFARAIRISDCARERARGAARKAPPASCRRRGTPPGTAADHGPPPAAPDDGYGRGSECSSSAKTASARAGREDQRARARARARRERDGVAQAGRARGEDVPPSHHRWARRAGACKRRRAPFLRWPRTMEPLPPRPHMRARGCEDDDARRRRRREATTRARDDDTHRIRARAGVAVESTARRWAPRVFSTGFTGRTVGRSRAHS